MTATPFQIDLYKRRSVWAILGAAASLYRRYPLLFLLLALAVVAPYDLAMLAITGYGPLARLVHHQGVYWLDLLLRQSLVGPLVSALHIYAVKTVGEGRRPQLRVVAARGLAVLPIVSATALLAGLGVALATLALVVPGLLLLTRWAVSSQVAAIERRAPLAAIRSSSGLTDGRRRHVLGLLSITIAISIAVDEIGRALPVGNTSAAPSVAIGIAVQTFSATFVALTLALLYFDLNAEERRRRKPRPPDFRAATPHGLTQVEP